MRVRDATRLEPSGMLFPCRFLNYTNKYLKILCLQMEMSGVAEGVLNYVRTTSYTLWLPVSDTPYSMYLSLSFLSFHLVTLILYYSLTPILPIYIPYLTVQLTLSRFYRTRLRVSLTYTFYYFIFTYIFSIVIYERFVLLSNSVVSIAPNWDYLRKVMGPVRA